MKNHLIANPALKFTKDMSAHLYAGGGLLAYESGYCRFCPAPFIFLKVDVRKVLRLLCLKLRRVAYYLKVATNFESWRAKGCYS